MPHELPLTYNLYDIEIVTNPDTTQSALISNFVTIEPPNDPMYGIGKHPTTGVLYGVTAALAPSDPGALLHGADQLVIIDPILGIRTLIGGTTIGSSPFLVSGRDLDFDPSGILWALRHERNSGRAFLFPLILTSGAFDGTNVKEITGHQGGRFGDLILRGVAFHSSGRLFAFAAGRTVSAGPRNPTLVEIDTTTYAVLQAERLDDSEATSLDVGMTFINESRLLVATEGRLYDINIELRAIAPPNDSFIIVNSSIIQPVPNVSGLVDFPQLKAYGLVNSERIWRFDECTTSTGGPPSLVIDINDQLFGPTDNFIRVKFFPGLGSSNSKCYRKIEPVEGPIDPIPEVEIFLSCDSCVVSPEEDYWKFTPCVPVQGQDDLWINVNSLSDPAARHLGSGAFPPDPPVVCWFRDEHQEGQGFGGLPVLQDASGTTFRVVSGCEDCSILTPVWSFIACPGQGIIRPDPVTIDDVIFVAEAAVANVPEEIQINDICYEQIDLPGFSGTIFLPEGRTFFNRTDIQGRFVDCSQCVEGESSSSSSSSGLDTYKRANLCSGSPDHNRVFWVLSSLVTTTLFFKAQGDCSEVSPVDLDVIFAGIPPLPGNVIINSLNEIELFATCNSCLLSASSSSSSSSSVEGPQAIPCVGTEVSPEQKIFEQFSGDNRRFGEAVSIDGIRAVFASATTKTVEAHRFLAEAWQFQEELEPSITGLAEYGTSVSVSGDDVVVLGANGENVDGKAFIFNFDGLKWNEIQVIDEPDLLKWTKVVINDKTIVISSINNSENGIGSGAVYIYKKSGSTYSLEQKLLASDGTLFDGFGSSISLDGDTLAVGSPFDLDTEDGSTEDGEGAVYIFTRSGSNWTQRTKLTSVDGTTVVGRRFGNSVALDGSTLVVGREGRDILDESSVFIFTGAGSSWIIDQIIAEGDLTLVNPDGLQPPSSPNIGDDIVVSGDDLFFNVVFSLSECTNIVYFQRNSSSVWVLVDVFAVDKTAEVIGVAAPLSLSIGKLVVGIPVSGDVAVVGGAVLYFLVSELGKTIPPDDIPTIEEHLDEVAVICDNDLDCYFDAVYADEYTLAIGGKWYYRQDQPGSAWFDKADNTRGWTVDFNLTVDFIENTSGLTEVGQPEGVGIYVNDGKYYESLYLLTQEILFANADRKVVYDTTSNTDYRLLGKGENIKLFAKRDTEKRYKKILDGKLSKSASNEANGRQPAVLQDSSGVLHVVWYDDGNNAGGQLFYAAFKDGAWSKPESVIETDRVIQNPDIALGSNGDIYVVYETHEFEATNIGFVYKNATGWSQPSFIGTGTGNSLRPRLAIDDKQDLHAVWEDNRLGHPEIFYNKWTLSTVSWGEDQRVSDSTSGSIRPSITVYRETAFIAHVEKNTTNGAVIKLSSYNSTTGEWTSSFENSDSTVTDATANQPDYPDILAGVDGQLFITWHDNGTGEFEIYNRIFVYNLTPLTDVQKITASFNDSRFPRLAEQSTTGDMYLVWEDVREIDPYTDPYNDPYLSQFGPRIFVAYYDRSNKKWNSSANGSFDVRIASVDDRTWAAPAVPDSFVGDLHILYEALLAVSTEEYVETTDLFANIKDAVYDLSRVEIFTILTDDYAERDLLVSDRQFRKEIRFGDFSNTLNARFTFGKIGYYLEDAVEPFEIIPVSHEEFDISAFSVNDAVVNDYGDAWLATNCGIVFYFADNGNISVLEDAGVQSINAITFNNNNVMFIARGSNVLFSEDHLAFTILDNATDNAGNITRLAFDNKNRLLVGTESNGLVITEVNGDLSGAAVQNTLLPGSHITALKADDNGVIWAGTRNGLARIFNDQSMTFTTAHGLPSNRINDISVRNTALRYIATAGGLAKMIGSAFESINSDEFGIWNNNIKSIEWQDPNLIWAGSLSRINQIEVDDPNNTYTAAAYSPKDYSHLDNDFDDLKTYFISSEEQLDKNSFVEVYLNGNRIHQGFDVVVRTAENAAQVPLSLIGFKTKLKSTDRVDVNIRNDVKLLSSFTQSEAEKNALGVKAVRIKDLGVDKDRLFAVTEGDENEIKINDTTSLVPHDKIHLDTTPPTGKITIVDQVDRSIVKIQIDDATDGDGSGLDKMIISNFTNFTTDGIATQSSQEFAISSLHDIGLSLNDDTDQLVFDSGTGISIEFVNSTHEIFAGTSNPGVLYKFDFSEGSWETAVTFASDEHVEFIKHFNNKFVVGVGKDGGSAKLYVYETSAFENPDIFTLDGDRAFSADELDGTLYVGTGPNGKVYGFDGKDLDLIVAGVDNNVRAIIGFQSNLYAGTGDEGRVYIIDPFSKTAIIVHTDSDTAVTAISVLDINGNKIFMGTESEGKILRSDVSDIAFNFSFQTLSNKVSALKVFTQTIDGTSTDLLHAAVGNVLYFLSADGVWTWKYTHSEPINDISFDENTNDIYVSSGSKITKVEPIKEEKTVYLKLIDKAGNETMLFDSQGNIVPDLTDSITISDLEGFINTNKILELDPFGNIVDSLLGDAPFYSGEKIDQEKGVFTSQVFNGTNDIIKWDKISWQLTEPKDTEVQIFVRSSAFKNDIELEEWQGPFKSDDAGGLDISFLSGQFLQFRADLLSKVKGVSPSLHRVTIRLITSEALHFFTTNFVLGSRLTKSLLTAQTLIPVSAEIVFGINTTNSVDWTDYTVIDENRIGNIDQLGEGLRVGIRFISPARALSAAEFDEYGPYGTALFINTIDVSFTADTAATYDFKVTLYDDIGLKNEVFSALTSDSIDGFSLDEEAFPEAGKTIASGDIVRLLFTVPGTSGIKCNTFYFAKIEAFNGTSFETISDDRAFIAGCNASFVDTIDFDFTNTTGATDTFGFRIRFYDDPERTTLSKTVLSTNDNTGWFVGGNQLSMDGVEVAKSGTVSLLFRPDLADFEANKIFHITIDSFDGENFILASNSFTFQARDITSLIYCGSYTDVPVVKNFGLMFELENKKFVTLNL